MNRLLTVMIVLLVLGIAVSRANDILVALSPYRTVEAVPAATAAPVTTAAELGARVPS